MVLIMPTATRRPVVPDGSQPTVGKVSALILKLYCLRIIVNHFDVFSGLVT